LPIVYFKITAELMNNSNDEIEFLIL